MFVRRQFLPSPHDPWKDPAWRWRRCGYLLEHGRRPLWGVDDHPTREAWLFRRELERCRDDADCERVAQDFPAFAEAHDLYTGSASLQRWRLEAYFLAGEDNESITAKCGMTEAAVRAYHDVFFEIRPHLQASTYIGLVVLGGKIHKGVSPDDHETILKALGYEMGGGIVDEVLDYLVAPPAFPSCLHALDTAALAKLQSKLRIHRLILGLTTPVEALSPFQWAELFRWFRASSQQDADAAALLVPITPTLGATACWSAKDALAPNAANRAAVASPGFGGEKVETPTPTGGACWQAKVPVDSAGPGRRRSRRGVGDARRKQELVPA
jgi:hypothetical protein